MHVRVYVNQGTNSRSRSSSRCSLLLTTGKECCVRQRTQELHPLLSRAEPEQ